MGDNSCWLQTIGVLLGLVSGLQGGVDIALDGRDVGFFLRPPQWDDVTKGVDSVERFTLLHSTVPVTVRAHYGPFSVKQTVLPALVAPSAGGSWNESQDESSVTSGDVLPALAAPPSGDLDVSANLVTHELKRDRPVLRVLFHSSRASDPKTRQHGDDTQKGALCVALYVHHQDQHLMAVCSPSASRDGVCLAEATLPASWWPPLEVGVWKSAKTQKTSVRVEYAVLQSHALDCSSSSLPVTAPPGVPSVYLADVALSSVHGSYEEVKGDDAVRILVPQGPVYPRSKVYVPVYLKPNPIYPLYVFVIRARVKSGLRILGAQVSQPTLWRISVDLNAKQTMATVTAFVKDTATVAPVDSATTSAHEVFTWLFEVEDDAGYHDNGRIIWQLRYMLDSSMAEQYDFDDDSAKMTSRLDIQKDDVQAVLPIAKSSQLLNTAVLNGRQVSQPMKVFVVSQAGKVGDVTLQSSCHAADESILKVSPSCTSVYLDGSEIRGSQNASVLVKYGTYTGQAHFLVWMPELPLVVRLSDTKLSQVKGWKTPQLQRRWVGMKSMPSITGSQGGLGNRANSGRRSNQGSMTSSRTDRWDEREQDLDVVCRLRYQQSLVDVYTRFFSVDHNSGREAYLLSRRAELRITELVAPFLRVADGRIASLKGAVVQGQQSGRTEVQVLSPITGRVIGAKEVRVGSDKETITHLEVTVVTGLQLSVLPEESMAGVFVAQTSVAHKLTSRYQEGLLDIRLHYSDGTATSLADITDTDYHLSVDTFDSGVVAFAPMAGLHHPRVIAIGEGRGDLLHVTLELAERCQKRRSQPLAMAYAFIEVDFTAALQNDARLKGAKGLADPSKPRLPPPPPPPSSEMATGGMRDVDSILYQDAMSPRGKALYHEPAVQARQNLVHPSDLTPLEIGMYALLGVFCLAILVFLVSCSVFAVRYKRKQIPATDSGDSVAHAHDWVWLGRATLERNSVNTRCSQTLVPMADFNGNHTSGGGGAGVTSGSGIVNGSATMGKVTRRDKIAGNGRQVGSGCRASNLSFPGSEISIRITTNPQELDEEETSMIEKGTVTCLANPNALHLPSVVDVNNGVSASASAAAVPTAAGGGAGNNNNAAPAAISSATTTREKRVRIVTNPVPPPILPANHMKDLPANAPPPVPPHRNFPPPVPPHGRHLLAAAAGSLKNREGGGPNRERRLNDMEWESVAQGMDYDQLIEYFENLKESNA